MERLAQKDCVDLIWNIIKGGYSGADKEKIWESCIALDYYAICEDETVTGKIRELLAEFEKMCVGDFLCQYDFTSFYEELAKITVDFLKKAVFVSDGGSISDGRSMRETVQKCYQKIKWEADSQTTIENKLNVQPGLASQNGYSAKWNYVALKKDNVDGVLLSYFYFWKYLYREKVGKLTVDNFFNAVRSCITVLMDRSNKLLLQMRKDYETKAASEVDAEGYRNEKKSETPNASFYEGLCFKRVKTGWNVTGHGTDSFVLIGEKGCGKTARLQQLYLEELAIGATEKASSEQTEPELAEFDLGALIAKMRGDTRGTKAKDTTGKKQVEEKKTEEQVVPVSEFLEVGKDKKKFPVWIKADALNAADLEDCIKTELGKKREPYYEYIMEKGMLSLYLDGINELSMRQKSELRKRLSRLMEWYPKIRVRMSDRRQGVISDKIATFECASFTKEQAKEYVECVWKEEATHLKEEILTEIYGTGVKSGFQESVTIAKLNIWKDVLSGNSCDKNEMTKEKFGMKYLEYLCDGVENVSGLKSALSGLPVSMKQKGTMYACEIMDHMVEKNNMNIEQAWERFMQVLSIGLLVEKGKGKFCFINEECGTFLVDDVKKKGTGRWFLRIFKRR